MFEDLEPEIDYKKKFEDALDLIRESRDEIKGLMRENQMMDRKFNNAYNDARRFAKIISNEIEEERLKKILKEQTELEEILSENNLLDEEDD